MGSGEKQDSGGGAVANQPPDKGRADLRSEVDSTVESTDFDEMDTTTWSVAAPPVLIEDEEETILSVPAPPSQDVQPEPAFEPELAHTPESVTLPPGGSAGLTDEEPTLLSVPLAAAVGTAASVLSDEPDTVIEQMTEEVTPPRTVAPSSSLAPMLLERIAPSMGRGERIRLDVRHWHVRLGRAEENEVRLYTASASREHALIAGNEEGQWIMTPSEGKQVFVDGEAVSEPMGLEVGMNLVLGKDHLRCVIEGLEHREGVTRTATEAFEGNRSEWAVKMRALGPVGMGALVLGALGLIALAFWLGA